MPPTITGIKPTGLPHLGNYLGMIRPALNLARTSDALCFIADYHALTTVPPPDSIRRAAVQDNLTAGRDRDQGVGMGLFNYPHPDGGRHPHPPGRPSPGRQRSAPARRDRQGPG